MLVVDLLQIELLADSLAEAVENGLAHFKCSRNCIETSILQAPTSGFLGIFGRRPARVRIKLTDRGTAARTICDQLLRLLGFPAVVTCESPLQPFQLSLDSTDPSLLIGRHGQTLDSLQSLLNSLLDRHFGSGEIVILDADGYRARRKEVLFSLARRLVSRARASGKLVTTPPLPVGERQILFDLFERESGIVARSKGHGSEKILVVSAQRG